MANQAVARNSSITLDDRSDDVLIMLVQSGDEGAFRPLVDRYKERVRNLIYSILNDTSIVDDIAQEVFIRVYEGLAKFRFESSFYTWLYRITVNKCRDEMRKKKMRKFFSLHVLMDSSNEELQAKITVQPDNSWAEELVTKGLQQLPEKFRIPIVLKDIDGFSYEEMAKIMECEIGTVKSRLSRARTMLRVILAPLLEG